jgi:hypothetical protein
MASNSRRKSSIKSPILVQYEVQSHSGVNDSALHVIAVLMTPLCKSKRCQWHRCDMQSNIMDTTVHITAVSMTPLCMSKWCQWLCCACHSGVNDTAVQVTAVSLIPLCHQLCRFPLQIWSHMSGVDLIFFGLNANRFDEKTVTLDQTSSEARHISAVKGSEVLKPKLRAWSESGVLCKYRCTLTLGTSFSDQITLFVWGMLWTVQRTSFSL